MRVLPGVVFLALLTLAWMACVTPREEVFKLYSSGRIGCSPDEIEISEPKRRGDAGGGLLAETWLATCRGRTYRCTSVAGSPPDVACAPKAD
jgi:hypothetical protein